MHCDCSLKMRQTLSSVSKNAPGGSKDHSFVHCMDTDHVPFISAADDHRFKLKPSSKLSARRLLSYYARRTKRRGTFCRLCNLFPCRVTHNLLTVLIPKATCPPLMSMPYETSAFTPMQHEVYGTTRLARRFTVLLRSMTNAGW